MFHKLLPRGQGYPGLGSVGHEIVPAGLAISGEDFGSAPRSLPLRPQLARQANCPLSQKDWDMFQCADCMLSPAAGASWLRTVSPFQSYGTRKDKPYWTPEPGDQGVSCGRLLQVCAQLFFWRYQ